MTIRYKNAGLNLTTTATETVLTCPTNATVLIKQIQINNGSGGNVNFTVNAIDTRGFQEALIQNRGTISNIINQAVNERGAKNLI